MMKSKFLVMLSAVLLVCTGLAASAFADTIYTPSSSHLTKVYLSPAKHSPDNIGCDNYAESANAAQIALKAKDYLVARGYIVRIGSGDYKQNAASSNGWTSQVHIPIHSNASAFNCSSTDSSKGGTWTMYATGDNADKSVANVLLAAMKDYSPGTNDKMGTDEAFSGKTLYELRQTTMPAGYVEAAFHTYGPDKNWLLNHTAVGNRIGLGIFQYFGSKSCSNTPCVVTSSTETGSADTAPTTEYITSDTGSPLSVSVSTEEVPVIDSPNLGFDPHTFGKTNARLKTDLQALLGRPAASSSLKETLINDVVVNEQGVAVVDFTNSVKFAKHVSGTMGTAEFLKQLNELVFRDKSIQQVYYQFDGSHSDWAYWLESVEGPVVRK